MGNHANFAPKQDDHESFPIVFTGSYYRTYPGCRNNVYRLPCEPPLLETLWYKQGQGPDLDGAGHPLSKNYRHWHRIIAAVGSFYDVFNQRRFCRAALVQDKGRARPYRYRQHLCDQSL